MKKIPTLYQRDPKDRRRVTDQVTPGCEWVLAGEGVPTRKYDGTCVMLDDDGHWWARREVKPGKTPPRGYQAVEHDETTGKTVGWEPAHQSSFATFLREAVGEATTSAGLAPGTYELVGPKINGNPEHLPRHMVVSHANATRFEGANAANPIHMIGLCMEWGWEGIVWHHPDGRMAKLKVRDYPVVGW